MSYILLNVSTSKDLCIGCRSDQDLTRTAAAKRTWNLYRTGKYNQGNIHRAATDSLGHWALPASAMDHVDLSLSSLNLACEMRPRPDVSTMY